MIRLALFLALVPVSALAGSVPADPVLAEVIKVQNRTIDCYCTDTSGSRIELGESICLQVGGRMFTAQCQMSLNVPMWRETQEGCLSSALDLPFSAFDPHTLQQPIQTFSVHTHI